MIENTASENWQNYSTAVTKRKRADLVCFACHAKKIKCDLRQQRSDGLGACKNCSTVGRACHVRPSKRDKRQKVDKNVSVTHIEQQPERAGVSNGVDVLLAGNATFQTLPRDSLSHGTAIAEDSQHSRASMISLRNTLTGEFRANVSPQSIYQAGPNPGPVESPMLQREGVGTSLAETTPNQNGDVDTGFLQVYAQENQFDAENQVLVAQLEHQYSSDLRPDLEQTFTDTYFEYCYPWCPVLDRSTIASDIARSPLLANALALASSHIQPPLLPHDGPEAYYKRARTIFYDDAETDETITLKALCLFYWWAPQSPSRVHRHSSWWWTSVIIRHAQQMNIHREPSVVDPNRERLHLGLRRRIWWTAFARERLTSLCQSKPVIINPDDCNIQEPTLADFPTDAQSQHQGEIFIYWVRLCAIIGRIAQFLLRSNVGPENLQNELREELVTWMHSLPARLRLSIEIARTPRFDRDVHQLHLFYLTTIIIMHLKRSEGQLPQALPPAILAASCTARILRDILARGNSRFLMAITCWHAGTAFIALLQACRIPHLSNSANEDLDVLSIAAKELQKMWASANVIAQGFERLRKPQPVTYTGLEDVNFADVHNSNPAVTSPSHGLGSLTNGTGTSTDDDFDWMRFFPFVSKSTGGIAQSLILGQELGTATKGFPSPNNGLFHGTLLAEFQDLFDSFTDFNAGFPDIAFNAT